MPFAVAKTIKGGSLVRRPGKISLRLLPSGPDRVGEPSVRYQTPVCSISGPTRGPNPPYLFANNKGSGMPVADMYLTDLEWSVANLFPEITDESSRCIGGIRG